MIVCHSCHHRGFRLGGLAYLAARVFGACALCLLAWGCGAAPDLGRLKCHRAEDFHFQYPGNWTLTHDTFSLDSPDSRVLILRAPDDAVFMIHRFSPPSRLSIEEFASTFAKERSQVLRDRGVQPPSVASGTARQSSLTANIAGRRVKGVREDLIYRFQGIELEHTTAFFRVEGMGEETFFTLHAPTETWAEAERGFATIFYSIGNDLPVAANSLAR